VVSSRAREFERVAFELPDRPAPGEGEDGDGPRVVMMVQREETGPDGETQRSTSVKEGDGMKTHEFSIDDLSSMLPEHQPDMRALLGWPDGRVWVVTARDDGDSMVTDEWSAEGRYLRRFPLSKEHRFYRVGRDGFLYGVAHDDDDYPIVHKLAVELR
jgi:hypothetical protein